MSYPITSFCKKEKDHTGFLSSSRPTQYCTKSNLQFHLTFLISWPIPIITVTLSLPPLSISKVLQHHKNSKHPDQFRPPISKPPEYQIPSGRYYARPPIKAFLGIRTSIYSSVVSWPYTCPATLWGGMRGLWRGKLGTSLTGRSGIVCIQEKLLVRLVCFDYVGHGVESRQAGYTGSLEWYLGGPFKPWARGRGHRLQVAVKGSDMTN